MKFYRFKSSLLTFITRNLFIFAVTFISILVIILSYIGIAYAVKSPEMLGFYLNGDYGLPFRSLSGNLYAKMYWDDTLTLPKEDVKKKYTSPQLFGQGDVSLNMHKYAAQKGNKNAQFYVGRKIFLYPYKYDGDLYRSPEKYSLDAQEKVKWLTKAAEQGHIEAMDSLGSLYEHGALYLPPDTTSAIKYYTQASDRGDLFAKTRTGALTHKGSINGHEWVDLGLPSGVKWATCNVGADSPEDYGDYFAWGETKPKSEYTVSNSFTYGKRLRELKSTGVINSFRELTPKYDAAHVNWGGSWRMPTREELIELREKCQWVWTKLNGKQGYEVTGSNGLSIFFPAAERRGDSAPTPATSDGYYWSSFSMDTSPDSIYSVALNFNSTNRSGPLYYRYRGFSIRPVSD